jgi:hypothetical protein
MGTPIRIVALIGLAALAAGCGQRQQDDTVYIAPEPVQAQPTYNKY